MQAYEGKTMSLKPGCPLCEGEVSTGYLSDRSDSKTFQVEWAEGASRELSIWTGGSISEGYEAMLSRRSGVRYAASWPRILLNHFTMCE